MLVYYVHEMFEHLTVDYKNYIITRITSPYISLISLPKCI